MTIHIVSLRFIAATLVIAACPARAEDVRCGEFPDLSANPTMALGHVAFGAPRVYFLKDALMQPGCPSGMPACAERAYLVPGDRVILTMNRDAFVCATYLNAKGVDRSGGCRPTPWPTTGRSRSHWPADSENGPAPKLKSA